MLISIIAALDRRGLIGAEGGLPWRLPNDLRRFRACTWGKPIIMGRRTFESIRKPLPGRFNIVLSQKHDYNPAGICVVRSLDDALSVAEKHLAPTGGDEAMIVGGGTVYAEAIERWDRMYLTVVEGTFTGSTYFPVQELLRQSWRPVCAAETQPADENNRHQHTFHVLERIRDESGCTTRSPEDRFREMTLADLDLAAILTREHRRS